MNIITRIMRYSYLLIALCTLSSVHNGNAMDPKKTKIFSAGSFAKKSIPVKQIFVRTGDGLIEQLPSWQVRQMKVLLVLSEHQRNQNSKQKPLEAFMISNQELQLLCSALNAASEGTFEEFWWRLVFADGLNETTILQTLGDGQLRMLVNVAEKVEAVELSALCASYYLPALAQARLNKPLVKTIKVQLRNLISSQMTVLSNHPAIEVLYSSDGNIVVEVRKHAVVVHDLIANSAQKHSLADANGLGFCSVALSPDGNYIFCATYEKDLFFWNRKTGNIHSLPLDEDNYNSMYAGVAFSNNGQDVLVAYGDEYRVYKIDNLLAVFEDDLLEQINYDFVSLNRADNIILSIVCDPQANKFFLGWKDGLVTCESPNEDSVVVLQLPYSEEDLTTVLTLSPDKKRLFAVRKNHVAMNDTESFKSNELYDAVFPFDVPFLDYISCFNMSPDGQCFVVAGDGIWGYRHKDFSVLFELFLDKYGTCNSVVFSPDGKNMAVGTESNCMLVPCVTDQQEGIINALNFYDIAQVRLLYQLCLASMDGNMIHLPNNDKALFESFDPLIQSLFMGVIFARSLEKKGEKLMTPLSEILLPNTLRTKEIKKQLQEMVAAFNESNRAKDFEHASVAQSAIQTLIQRNQEYREFINKTLQQLGYSDEK